MNTPGKKKADIILIAALLLAALSFLLFQLFSRQSGAVVKVSVGGEVVKELSLYRDQRYEINGVNGGFNTLVIENGQAWIEDADCPDALCVHMGKISFEGQSIVCLPHKVVVTVEGKASQSSVDAVAK
ncbi:MAG: NusG domain II-containing protein [Sphaerochaetaceae bacterium]|nr:NusG domain II-containing protein [Sphaerochaetaceae bacterium]